MNRNILVTRDLLKRYQDFNSYNFFLLWDFETLHLDMGQVSSMLSMPQPLSLDATSLLLVVSSFLQADKAGGYSLQF